MATPLTDVLEGRDAHRVIRSANDNIMHLSKCRSLVENTIPPMIDDALIALEGGEIELAQVILERMRESLLGVGHAPG